MIRRRKGRRKRLTARHKRNISRSLSGRTRRSTRRLNDFETASKIVRNVALAAETPSKVARNASVTAKNLSSLSYGLDRNLNRLGKGSRSLDTLTKTGRRLKSPLNRVRKYLF